MQYQIKGTPLPVVECSLQPGESMVCEAGSMSWMSSNMKMETNGGGLGKMFSKAFSGEKMFQNIYTAEGGPGVIAFASSFPGNIMAIEVGPGKEIVCQKSAFLASTPGVQLSIFFNKKVGAGLFGGEGFIMQKLSGSGIAFIEIDGSAVEYELGAGEPFCKHRQCLCVISARQQADFCLGRNAEHKAVTLQGVELTEKRCRVLAVVPKLGEKLQRSLCVLLNGAVQKLCGAAVAREPHNVVNRVNVDVLGAGTLVKQ